MNKKEDEKVKKFKKNCADAYVKISKIFAKKQKKCNTCLYFFRNKNINNRYCDQRFDEFVIENKFCACNLYKEKINE